MRLSVLLFAGLLIICLAYRPGIKLCEAIKETRPITQLKFPATNLEKTSLKGLKQIENSIHPELFIGEKTYEEKNYLFGKFLISKDRLGLVCFNITKECDADFYFMSLHIIDKCASVNDYITLAMSSDDGGALYDISSSLNKTFDTLTIKKETTSEWAVGNDSNIDTLFTEIYKLNLKSKNLDTVSRRSFYKPIRNN